VRVPGGGCGRAKRVRAPRSMSSRGPRRGSSQPLAKPATGVDLRCGLRLHRGGAFLRVRVAVPPRWLRVPRVRSPAPPRWCLPPRAGRGATGVAPCPTGVVSMSPAEAGAVSATVVQVPGPANRSELLRRSIAHDPASRGVATATMASWSAPANRRTQVDAIWSTGSVFLRGVAHGPWTRRSWDLVRANSVEAVHRYPVDLCFGLGVVPGFPFPTLRPERVRDF
jgi:hypothetical protein